MWTIEAGLGLVRAIQDSSRDYGFHVALGGSVLNKGKSDKDLDLYFLPMNNPKKYVEDQDGLIKWLTKLWGKPELIGDYGQDRGTFRDYVSNPGPAVSFDVETPRNLHTAARTFSTQSATQTPNGVIWRTVTTPPPPVNPPMIWVEEGAELIPEDFWGNGQGPVQPVGDEVLNFGGVVPKYGSGPERDVYREKLKFHRKGGDRIDVFIL